MAAAVVRGYSGPSMGNMMTKIGMKSAAPPMPLNIALYTGRHKSTGTIMKRPGKTAGSDFADNHVAGGD